MIRPTLINHFAFPILVAAGLLQIFWIWGLLFICWAVQSLRVGTAHLVFPVEREEDTILFWGVLVMWFLSGALMIFASIFPDYANILV